MKNYDLARENTQSGSIVQIKKKFGHTIKRIKKRGRIMLIGMFHIRKDPNKVSRAYLYSTIARHEGHDFFYFTAKGVDFEKKEILGKHYSNGRWVTKRFPFPDVVINAANQNTPFQEETEDRLKTLLPFTSHPVGTKANVYRKILAGEKYKASHTI